MEKKSTGLSKGGVGGATLGKLRYVGIKKL